MTDYFEGSAPGQCQGLCFLQIPAGQRYEDSGGRLAEPEFIGSAGLRPGIDHRPNAPSKARFRDRDREAAVGDVVRRMQKPGLNRRSAGALDGQLPGQVDIGAALDRAVSYLEVLAPVERTADVPDNRDQVAFAGEGDSDTQVDVVDYTQHTDHGSGKI